MTALANYHAALNALDGIRNRREDREATGTYNPAGESEAADARVWHEYHSYNPALGSTLLHALESEAAAEEMREERTL